MTNKRNIDFLYEMGMLRFIPRTWRQFLNKDFANVSEHVFRTMWIALIIATEEKADVGKILKMALVHDIVESRTGDTNYVTRMYVQEDEERAVKDTLQGTSMEEEFLELFSEYKAKKTLEAKIVKDADNLDVDMELMEQYANGVRTKEVFQAMRENVAKMFFTETAKQMWQDLQNSDPHNWHWQSRNRFTKGDFKKETRKTIL